MPPYLNLFKTANMNETALYSIIGILLMTVGFYFGNLISKLTLEKKHQLKLQEVENLRKRLEDEKIGFEQTTKEGQEKLERLRLEKDNALEQLREQNKELTIEVTKGEAALKNNEEKLQENKEEIDKLHEKFNKEFENLANKILEEKTNKFTLQNKENLKQILTPLQDKIQNFEKKVEDTNKESIGRHATLKTQIEGLRDLNLKMSKEAVNLTKALKGDSKTQGNWGEMILESVLEKSGLEKGREYDLEKSFEVSGVENKKRLRPDVIINLPDNRKMVIDSKVSLTAYEQYVNTDTEEERTVFLKEHVNSLRRHVDQLSAKKYEDLHQIESPDFVLLFVPIEPAFGVALESDNELYNKAFVKNIVIVTPATLLATLRTIDSMWQNEKQQRNAIEIARQAGALYDKFEGLWQDLIKVGRKMEEAKKEYDGAMKKLIDGKGNLITSVQKIKKLGAKAKKALPIEVIERAEES
jgi:DNA recombination protein RmuC